ncbi:hypothetical protein ABZX77_44640 [Streptomyces sp. NPDC004237]|uniref:hypothetical protein n=1 Tax=Streptomyces sp. NPDC004237 TaxID=3154455 RepID=UPI0033BBC210
MAVGMTAERRSSGRDGRRALGEPGAFAQGQQLVRAVRVDGEFAAERAGAYVDEVVAEPLLLVLGLTAQGDDGCIRGQVAAAPFHEDLLRAVFEGLDGQGEEHLTGGVAVEGDVFLSVVDGHELLPVRRQVDENPVAPRVRHKIRLAGNRDRASENDRAVLALSDVEVDAAVHGVHKVLGTVPDRLPLPPGGDRPALGVVRGQGR